LKNENNRYKKVEKHNHQHEHEHNNHVSLHETQRLKALISHWIEHNIGHLEKMREYAKLAEAEDAIEVAKYLNEAVNHMQKSINSLELALKHL
jgi:G3E family GTPase